MSEHWWELVCWWCIRIIILVILAFGAKLMGGWMMVVLFIMLGLTSLTSALLTAERVVDIREAAKK